MIETLKIKLLDGMHAYNEWECALEIPIDYNLDELHQAVLSAVDFDDDHMYEFCQVTLITLEARNVQHAMTIR